MATVDEPEIWEDLEKLNLNGLKPAPTPIVTPKPIKNTESEQQQVSLEEVDDALLEALKDSKERSTVIEFEDKVECFIKDASLDVLEFPHTQSTYHRKLAHRVAQHYGLSTSTVEHDDGQVHVVAKRATRIGQQVRLSTLELRTNGSAACPAGSTSNLPAGDPPRLLTRPGGTDISSANGNGEGDAAAAPVRTAKERQEDYMRDKERLLGQAAGAAAATATGGDTVERSSTRGPTPGGRGSSGQQGSISQAAGRHQGGGGGGRYGSGGRGHYMNGAGSGMMGGREDGGGGRGANKRSTPKDKASELQDPDYHRGIERFNGTARFDPSYGMGPGAMGFAGHMGPQGIYHVPTYMNEFPTLGQHPNAPRGFRQDPSSFQQQQQQQQQWSNGGSQHNGAGPAGRGSNNSHNNNNNNWSRQAPPGPIPPPGGPHSSPPPPPPPSNNASSPNGNNNNHNNGRAARDGHSPTRSSTRSAKSQHSLQGGGSTNNNQNSNNHATMKGARGFNNNNMPLHGSSAPVLPLQPYPYMPGGGMQVAYASPPNGMYPYPYPMQQFGQPMGLSMSPTAGGYPNVMYAPFPPGGAPPQIFNAQTAAAMGLYPIQPGFAPYPGPYEHFVPQLQHQGQGYEYAYPQQQFQQPQQQQHMHFPQQQSGGGYRTSGSGSTHA